MLMKKLKVGFVAGFMDGFSRTGLDLFAQYQKELDKMSEEMGFEIIHFKKEMLTIKDAQKIRTKLDAEDVDFLLLFHPAYIIGDLVFELMKTRADVGLWAIEEPRDEGPMPLASFVNLSQNSSIARHNFKNGGKKVKWFFGPIDGPLFKPRFDITVRAQSAIKNLEDAKVTQIGKLADGHINHYNDVRDIYRNIGVDVSRDYEVEDVIAMGEEMPRKQVQEELKKLGSATTAERISAGKIEDSVRMYLAIKSISEENEYSAVAFSCWPKLMPLKGMTGCLINALLNNTGIVAGCEADVLSTVSMLTMKYFTGSSTVLMDLPKFDANDNSLMLWHCGTSPFDMADKRGVKLERHYFADYTEEERYKDVGPITDVVFRPSDLTVFRFTGDAESFYYFTGKTTDGGKKTFHGSRGWVKDLRLYGEPVKVIDLMNTMLVNGLPHHYPMVLNDVGKYIEEFAYWKGLKKIKKVEYKDYLYVPADG
jgi:L-fucose isomerase-like protein